MTINAKTIDIVAIPKVLSAGDINELCAKLGLLEERAKVGEVLEVKNGVFDRTLQALVDGTYILLDDVVLAHRPFLDYLRGLHPDAAILRSFGYEKNGFLHSKPLESFPEEYDDTGQLR